MHACKFFFTSAYFVCRQNLFKMCTTIVISVIFLFILGVMRLLSIWLLLMAALGCIAVHGLRENDAENKNELRLNYGVYFRAIRKVYAINDNISVHCPQVCLRVSLLSSLMQIEHHPCVSFLLVAWRQSC